MSVRCRGHSPPQLGSRSFHLISEFPSQLILSSSRLEPPNSNPSVRQDFNKSTVLRRRRGHPLPDLEAWVFCFFLISCLSLSCYWFFLLDFLFVSCVVDCLWRCLSLKSPRIFSCHPDPLGNCLFLSCCFLLLSYCVWNLFSSFRLNS